MSSKNNQIIPLRIIAFVIDFAVVGATIGAFDQWSKATVNSGKNLPIELVIFVLIPFGFFLYWFSGLDLGKRLFGLRIVNAESGEPATIFQLFKRSLLFTLLVSLNVLFLIPILASKKSQGFHDMLAGTIVVRKDGVEKGEIESRDHQ